MWCGNFSAYFQQSDSVSSPLFSKILKIQREICRNQSDEIFRALNFKNFFGKLLRASFFQRFYFQEVVFQAEFYSAAWYSSVSFFSRRVSVSDVVSEISFFKSSPQCIQSVKQKMNSDHIFKHISVWIQFLFNHSKSWNSFRSVIFGAISHNGSRLGDVADF